MKRSILLAIMAFAVAAFIGVTATPSMAVHKSSGNGLACGACHTMHASEANTQTNTPADKLLQQTGSTTADFCLKCHAQNGDNAAIQYDGTTPPKVYLTGAAWVSGDTYASIGAGGDFRMVGSFAAGAYTDADGANASGSGHSISTDATPPGGDSSDDTGASSTQITGFTCTSCHDAHGTSATVAGISLYRNLLSGIGDDVAGDLTAINDFADSYVGGVAGDTTTGTSNAAAGNIWPVWKSAGAGNQNTYDRTLATFCAQCHGLWHEAAGLSGTNNYTAAGEWKRHPVDETLAGANYTAAPSGSVVDTANYPVGDVGTGVPVTDGAGSAFYSADNTADGVFCLSCHFAHGSLYNNSLRWDYGATTSVASGVGCQQCHNK